MEKSLDTTFDTLEKITALRFKSEQSFIDLLDTQLKKSNNKSITPLVNGGINFLNSVLENRHELERSILRKIKIEVEKNSENNNSDLSEEITTSQPVSINSGTFLIKSFLSQKSVQIPLNINNNYEEVQDIVVDIDSIKNMKTGDIIKNKIAADQVLISIPAKKSAQLKIDIDLKNGFKTQNQYFSTLVLKGNEHRIFQIIIEVLSAKNKKEKASLTFLPQPQ